MVYNRSPDSSTSSSSECAYPNSSSSEASVDSTNESRSGHRASRALSCARRSTPSSCREVPLTSRLGGFGRDVDCGAHPFELEHAVDVDAAQLEHAFHARERGDRVDVATH